jgi:hypothetical protein
MLQSGVLQPEGDRMTDSAVLDTILGLIFLFYALALLCGGLVEMIANWVKKRAKYLLRGIRDLLDDVVQAEVAMPDRKGWMQSTAGTVYLNGMVEKQGYDEVLHAHVPTLPNEPAAAAPTGPGATSPLPGQSMHRNKITLSDVMLMRWFSLFGTPPHWASQPVIPRICRPVCLRGPWLTY